MSYIFWLFLKDKLFLAIFFVAIHYLNLGYYFVFWEVTVTFAGLSCKFKDLVMWKRWFSQTLCVWLVCQFPRKDETLVPNSVCQCLIMGTLHWTVLKISVWFKYLVQGLQTEERPPGGVLNCFVGLRKDPGTHANSIRETLGLHSPVCHLLPATVSTLKGLRLNSLWNNTPH